MKKYLVFMMGLLVTFSGFANAAPSQQELNAMTLMTAQDAANNAPSNLILKNNSGQAMTVDGLFLYGVAFITPGQNCQNGIQSLGQNYIENQGMQGGISTPIPMNAGQSIPIGQNYLYNMLYTWLYWEVQIGSPAICALPGCSWSTDTTKYNWCFQVGAQSPTASYTYTDYRSNTLPYAWPTINLANHYNYDLIQNVNSYVWLAVYLR